MNPSNQSSTPSDNHLSRRQFLRNSTLAVAGGLAAANFPSVLGQEKPAINAVIIGLGGRGGGAGENFQDAVKIADVDGKIVAVADLFPEQARRGTRKPFNLPEEKCFSGFDAYLKAINEPGVNYVIVATPPGFKPSQVRASIEAGKNVFTEKPVAADGAGCRVMYASGELAAQKGLKVAAGTQRRHQAGYIETIKRLQDGAIGDIIMLRAYWVNGGPIWHRGDHGDTALERQIRNWYHYIWLCGDHICEQHVHNLDVCNWVMNAHPVRCWGQGSRQQLGNKSGEIWDNFDVEYDYPEGVKMFSYCGQIKRSGSPGVDEFVHGTKGMSKPSGNIRLRDGGRWRSSLKLDSDNPYVQEHVDLIRAIVKNSELNEVKNVTDSTLTAIMGREASYSGAWVEWDEVLNSKFQYGPELVYENSAKMEFGDFRTLKPPMPSLFNILADPPMFETV
jgi:myo-inositol 2-dehydrogenase / D-chiro-inositol 1-dehydrogenase